MIRELAMVPANHIESHLLYDLLAQVEGNRWKAEQLHSVGPYTIKGVCKDWQYVKAQGYGREDMTHTVIYGAGGYNRYGIREDGTVFPIAESFPNKEKLDFAKRILK